ncbi:Uncharacterised protein [Klebsiella pneumoniae]|nr:Uncharacterised protein [Klebsiella pneumoniae]
MEHPVNEAKPQQRQPCRRRVLRHRLQQAAEFQIERTLPDCALHQHLRPRPPQPNAADDAHRQQQRQRPQRFPARRSRARSKNY